MSDNPTKPKRIQRKRTKGWRMPPNTVSVTRPGRYGNVFCIGAFCKMCDPDPNYKGAFRLVWSQSNQPKEYALRAGFTEITDAATAVEWFRRLRTSVAPFTKDELKSLRGKDLACWCPLDQSCHADVLLEIANAKDSL